MSCEQSGCCISFPVLQSEVSAPQSSGRTEEVHSPKRKKMRFSDLEEPGHRVNLQPETSTLRVKHLPLPDSSSSLDPCQHPGSQIVSRQEKGRAFSRESVPSKKQGLTKRTVGTPQPESNQWDYNEDFGVNKTHSFNILAQTQELLDTWRDPVLSKRLKNRKK